MVGRHGVGIAGGHCAIATRSPSMSPTATGSMKVAVAEQVYLSAGMQARHGHSRGRVLTGTMAGLLPPTRPIPKCGMPLVLPVHGKHTVRTMPRRLSSARWGAHHGNH